jgi:hypothetical protein
VIQPVLGFWDSGSNGYAGMPRCPEGFAYTSGNNHRWVSPEEMKHMIQELNLPAAKDLVESWQERLLV